MSAWLRIARLVLGVLLIVVGVALVGAPFASLTVLLIGTVTGLLLLGIAELFDSDAARWQRASGLIWIAGAVAVLVWPGLTIAVLAIIVGISLVVAGVARIASGLRATTDARVAAILLGGASIVCGALALSWPDITVFVVAVVFGVRVALAGVVLAWSAVRGRYRVDEPGRSHPWWRTIGSIAALVVALALAGVSVTLHEASPTPDAFYEEPSDLDEVPDASGVLLRSDRFDRALPEGAMAWRILYTTTRDEGRPAVASALVIAPETRPSGRRPVVAWAHGTTGFAEGCAPSVLDDPFKAGATPALEEVIERGWVMVAPDYVGLGTEGPHPYLIGQGEGRSVLDAVVAARQLDELSLGGAVVWGHSQGGHAALWSGVLATEDYAPDADVVGVVAMAPASNLPGLVGNLDMVPGGPIFTSFVLSAYSEVYDDVEFREYIRPVAQVQMREIAQRCLAEPGALVSVVDSVLFGDTVFAKDPTTGPLGERLTENIPSGDIEVPVLVAQGEADPLVLPEAQQEYVDARCDEGYAVDYRTYPDEDHLSVVADDSDLIDDLLAWTQSRFDRVPVSESDDYCAG